MGNTLMGTRFRHKTCVAGCICTVVRQQRWWWRWRTVLRSPDPTQLCSSIPIWMMNSVNTILQASSGSNFPLCCLFLITLSFCTDGVMCQNDTKANITDPLATAGSGKWKSKSTHYKPLKSGAFVIVKWQMRKSGRSLTAISAIGDRCPNHGCASRRH